MDSIKYLKVPQELRDKWREEAPWDYRDYIQLSDHLIAQAAQWAWNQREPEIQAAADREREEICHWLITGPYGASIACHAEHMISDLQYARRPKPPPSLKQQGLDALSLLCEGPNPTAFVKCKDTILRALEALPDD